MPAKKKGKGKSAKLPPDPNLIKTGIHTFVYENGDKYRGEFIANIEERSVFRHGFGTYKTWDNQIYRGIWFHDNLQGEVEIIYPDGGCYRGLISPSLQYSEGIYILPDENTIQGNFSKNIPTEGFSAYVDVNMHQWDLKVNGKIVMLRHQNRFKEKFERFDDKLTGEEEEDGINLSDYIY